MPDGLGRMTQISNALTTQAEAIAGLRRALADLSYELTDLRISLIQYDVTLDQVAADAGVLGDISRDTAAMIGPD